MNKLQNKIQVTLHKSQTIKSSLNNRNLKSDSVFFLGHPVYIHIVQDCESYIDRVLNTVVEQRIITISQT